ncbi:MAG TPA: hypothetical protein VHN80_06165 [Kineosporiaceae bacterium]|nr:hypothetical protein [Kineosporiaceae bacterium]
MIRFAVVRLSTVLLAVGLTGCAGSASGQASGSASGSTAAPSGSPTPSISAAATASDVGVTIAPSVLRDPKGVYTETAVAFRVSGSDAAVAKVIENELNAAVSSAERDFAQRATSAPKDTTPYKLTVSVAAQNRWGSLFSVRLVSDMDLHGAHGYAAVQALTVDLHTGSLVTVHDLFASVPAVDAAVRQAFTARDNLVSTPGEITVGETSVAQDVHVWSYPTAAGLVVAASQCAPEPCSSGLPVFVLPWNRLPATIPGVLPL